MLLYKYFYIDCGLAIEHCTECKDFNTCTNCKSGYILGKDNKCQKCSELIEHCNTCSNSSTCTQCQAPYILKDKKCSDKCQGDSCQGEFLCERLILKIIRFLSKR